MSRAQGSWFSMCCVVLLGCMVAPPVVGAAADEGETEGSCLALIGGEDVDAAIEACREAVAERPDDLGLTRKVAKLEYDEGDPDIAAGLYVKLLDREGWSLDTARDLGASLWRAGRLEEAESVLRDTAERAGTAEAHADLIRFLSSLNRWDDAAAAAATAIEALPEACELSELAGVAEAGAGHHGEAAKDFAAAVAKGCPPYRWATLGPLPEVVSNPAYRVLMDPGELVEGLDAVDDRECELRLTLLELVITPAQAGVVTDQVLSRDKLEVRYAGLGLLTGLGADAMAQWPRLLADDDFVLRKLTLRRIREIGNPAFAPMLEAHLAAGTDTPGNMNLTRLTLGELLLKRGEGDRAVALLASIPEDDPLYAVGRVALADHAEAEGEIAAALGYLEQALAADPEVFVDRDRLDKLRSAVAGPTS